jgi:hypothetical protein
VALTLAHDGRSTQAVTRRQLAAWRGAAVRTLDDHLAALRARGLVRSAAAGRGGGLVFTPTRLPDRACRPGGSSGSGSAISDRGDNTSALTERSDSGTPAARRSRPPKAAARSTRQRSPSSARQAPRPRDPPQSPEPLLEVEADLEAQDRDLLLSESGRPGYEASGPESRDWRNAEALALAVERLEEVGVYPGLSQRIARLAWVTPELIEAWINRLKRQRQVRHLGALLVAVLRDPTRCLPAPWAAPLAAPEPAPDGEEADGPDQDQDAFRDDEDDSLSDAAPARAVNLPFVWDDWLLALRGRLGERSVEAWLTGAQPLSWADGVLVVAVPSAMGVDWLTTRYGRELDLAARELAGRPVNVRLVTARAPRR